MNKSIKETKQKLPDEGQWDHQCLWHQDSHQTPTAVSLSNWHTVQLMPQFLSKSVT